jgi:hypothetical protein
MRNEHLVDHDVWVLELEGGERLRSRSVLIATGAQYRRLDAEGRERFEGARRLLCGPHSRPAVVRTFDRSCRWGRQLGWTGDHVPCSARRESVCGHSR